MLQVVCDGKEEAVPFFPFPPHPAPAVRVAKTTRNESAASRDSSLLRPQIPFPIHLIGVIQRHLALVWSQELPAGTVVDHSTVL